MSASPQKGALLHMGKNIRSPSMEPHADGRPTYSGVQPGSTRGLNAWMIPICKDCRWLVQLAGRNTTLIFQRNVLFE